MPLSDIADKEIHRDLQYDTIAESKYTILSIYNMPLSDNISIYNMPLSDIADKDTERYNRE